MSRVPGIVLDPSRIQTNIVIFELSDGDVPGFLRRLQEHGVKAHHPYGTRVRMVTHYGITREDINVALEAVESAMKERSGLHPRG